ILLASNDSVASRSSVNGGSTTENTSEGHKELPSVSVSEGDDVIDKEHSVDSEQEYVATHTNTDAQTEDVDLKDQFHIRDVYPARVQDQLDE
ncbi:hypothetical protein MKX03_025748, partial [Papaver bracteatum]